MIETFIQYELILLYLSENPDTDYLNGEYILRWWLVNMYL